MLLVHQSYIGLGVPVRKCVRYTLDSFMLVYFGFFQPLFEIRCEVVSAFTRPCAGLLQSSRGLEV